MKKTIPIILLFLVCLSYTITAYAEGENNSWDESDASEGPWKSMDIRTLVTK